MRPSSRIGRPAARARRMRLGALVGALAVAATAAVASIDGGDTADAQPVTPREHRVAVFSDSVGLGARHAIPAAFPADWEVNVVGQPARFVEQLENGPCFWTLTGERCDVRFRLAASPHWFGDHVVIAAGYNYPYWDPARFDASVDSMVRTLTAAGVKHVYWVTLREIDPRFVSPSAFRQVQQYAWYFPEVNDRLESALARHSNLTLIDWAAAANQPDLTYDAIHLNQNGAEQYARLIERTIRSTATTVADRSTTRVEVPGAAGAAAAAVNLTTTAPRRSGHLTVHRCGETPPRASVHNYTRGEVVAHATVAPLGPDGSFCVTAHAQTNLIVDVTGVLRDDGRYRAVRPTRWVDTRARRPIEGGRTLRVDVADIPSSADVSADPAALALAVTAVRPSGRGHVTVSPCGADATHSNLNYLADATPNLVVTEPGPDGTVCFFVSSTTDLVVDVLGEFIEVPAGDGEVAAATPVDVGDPRRLRDSRRDGAPVPAGGVMRVAVGDALDDPSNSAVLNLTGLGAQGPGHLTLYACDEGRGSTSSLNLRPGQVVANAVIVRPDADGEVCVYARTTSHVVVDLLGEITDVFDGSIGGRVLDTRRS